MPKQAPPPAPKRSDWVVEQIKAWIMREGLGPGDRLPNEAELVRRFGVAKGTMREALKSLEVQGLIRVTTGPNGGATLRAVPAERAVQLLGNYFYFKDLRIDQVYAMRKLVEPAVAAAACGHLTPAQFAALEDSIHLCACVPDSKGMEHRQRLAELDFHDILAEACPNPLLGFASTFMNSVIKDSLLYRAVYAAEAPADTPPGMRDMAADGLAAHRVILAALRAGDPAAARRAMADHMAVAERHMIQLETVLPRRFMTDGAAVLRPVRRRATT